LLDAVDPEFELVVVAVVEAERDVVRPINFQGLIAERLHVVVAGVGKLGHQLVADANNERQVVDASAFLIRAID
jgi:hypothetical protein